MFSRGQQKLNIRVTGTENKLPISATIIVKGSDRGQSNDSTGRTTMFFPAKGEYSLIISAVGFVEKETKIVIPYSSDSLEIKLENDPGELEEVIIQSTRTSRTIANVPTRVETIDFEEIDEKNNMRPANVAMLLHESTGIQVKQTSATSGNASIRIQGLDGRYTQLLKDGFSNFGNFSSGLSVLEIPPLDLKQVEIIKGPASPLFGGGAIAGVVNFISKTPKAKPEYNVILNQSSIGQTNIGGFASGKNKSVGYTMLALYNRSTAYDADKDEFTEVPKSNELTLHPKLFIYPNESATITIGNSLTLGTRTGGDTKVIKGKADAAHQYFEKNKTFRNISTLQLDLKLEDGKSFVAKQSFGVFNRTINIPGYSFSGIDNTAYTDVSYLTNGNKHAFVLGANFIYNRFNENADQTETRNNMAKTAGIYGQHTWDASDNVKLESGLRVDLTRYQNTVYSNTEVFLLPRISLLIKYGPKWSSRIGAGLGYKTPTLFTEETESIQYQNIAQLNNVVSERSYGGTADLNFKTDIGENIQFTFNHMLFYTLIERPLILESDGVDNYRFANAGNAVRSAGMETNAKLIYRKNLKLFLGYTYTDTKAGYLMGNQTLPLVPKNKLNTALIYEKAEVIKLALEGYFTGRQYLSNGMQTPSYVEFGFMAEKMFRNFSIFINFENFTDTRQGRYKNVVNGSHLNPSFDEIWTHTEGFVVNGGLKLKF